MGQFYHNKKVEFDNMVFCYIMKRLTEPVEATDAFKAGVIDDFGCPTGAKNSDAWAYTNLDRLVFKLRGILGERGVSALGNKFADVNYMAMMGGAIDPDKYRGKYDGVVALVEQSSYLPDADRTSNDLYVADDSEYTYDERVSRAMTVASYLMFCIKNERIPSEREFENEVLQSTEVTFEIRAIGTNEEIYDYLYKSKIVNSRGLTNEGYVLAVRLAKWIVAHELTKTSKSVDNQSMNWRQLSSAG